MVGIYFYSSHRHLEPLCSITFSNFHFYWQGFLFLILQVAFYILFTLFVVLQEGAFESYWCTAFRGQARLSHSLCSCISGWFQPQCHLRSSSLCRSIWCPSLKVRALRNSILYWTLYVGILFYLLLFLYLVQLVYNLSVSDLCSPHYFCFCLLYVILHCLKKYLYG